MDNTTKKLEVPPATPAMNPSTDSEVRAYSNFVDSMRAMREWYEDAARERMQNRKAKLTRTGLGNDTTIICINGTIETIVSSSTIHSVLH